MAYPQSPDFQGVVAEVSDGFSHPPIFPHHGLFPGREENQDQDFLNEVAENAPSTRTRVYYAWPRET